MRVKAIEILMIWRFRYSATLVRGKNEADGAWCLIHILIQAMLIKGFAIVVRFRAPPPMTNSASRPIGLVDIFAIILSPPGCISSRLTRSYLSNILASPDHQTVNGTAFTEVPRPVILS